MYSRGQALLAALSCHAATSSYSDQFTIDGLLVTLKSVDPSLVQWVLKYLQPFSIGTDDQTVEKTTCVCLNSDELVIQAANYLATPGITTFRVSGKEDAKLHCSRISINTTIYFDAKEGVFWLTDFASSTVYLVHSSRSSQPSLEFARTVRSVIMTHLESQGWVSYHAGAVETENGLIMIVGNSGAGKTSLILDLLAGGARFVANERLLVRDHENGFHAMGYPMAIAVGLGTALQFGSLAGLVENPDALMYPRHRYSKSRVARAPLCERQNLEDKLQFLPQELTDYMDAPGITISGPICALVVPKVNRTCNDTAIRSVDSDESMNILSENYMELTYDRSHPVWREADTRIGENTANIHSIEALSKIKTVEFQYSLSPMRAPDNHLNKIYTTIQAFDANTTKPPL